MKRLGVAVVILWACCLGAFGQGVMADVMAGKPVKPKVGQWAWYDLTDAKTQDRYVIRQAIVGKEKVGRKSGFWLEIEVIPQLGTPSAFKMLVTGPANNPKNVHRILLKMGNNPPQEQPVGDDGGGAEMAKKGKKVLVAKEEIATPQGAITAEHYRIEEDGKISDIWLNDDVRPMGIVRLRSSEGELVLREYGRDGEHAVSAFDQANRWGADSGWKVNRGARGGNLRFEIEGLDTEPKTESGEDAE